MMLERVFNLLPMEDAMTKYRLFDLVGSSEHTAGYYARHHAAAVLAKKILFTAAVVRLAQKHAR